MSDASLEAISRLNDNMQKMFHKLLDRETANKAAINTILQHMPNGDECKTKIIEQLKDLASAHDRLAEKGRDNEFAMIVRTLGGTYP